MMLLEPLVAFSVLSSFVASAPQECRHGRCRSNTAVQSGSLPSEIASATDDVPLAPVETDAGSGDGEDPEEAEATTTMVSVEPTTPRDEDPASSATTPVTSATTPVASGGGGGGDYWTPSMSDTFVVDLENRPIPSNPASVYVVDLAHTDDQIAAYKADGKKVICYFSAGAWDSYRDDKLLFNAECYCGKGETQRDETTGICSSTVNKQDAWDAWWFDLVTPACVSNLEEVLTARMVAAKRKGCDGIDPDNVDSAYNDHNTYGNTPADQLTFNLWLAKTAHDNGLAIDLKNANDLVKESEDYKTALVDAFDYNVIESCHKYDACADYQPFLDAKKPQIQLEYLDTVSIDSCDAAQEGVGMLVYQTVLLDSKDITLTCPS